MRRLSCLLFSLALVSLMSVPVDGQEKKKEKEPAKKMEPPKPAPGPSFKHLDGQMLVFVVNGAGGSSVVSDNLLDVNEERHFGLCIHSVPWCRHQSLYQDLRDQEAQLTAAHKLAGIVTALHRDAPKAHVHLVGHSVGARVVLAAAEMVPPASVERIILLSPAVSCGYDLTRALKASRYGLDNFYSTADGILDHENGHYRNADGGPGFAAGKHGFRLASSDKKDAEAYRAVRQYAWNEEFCGSGGHYVWALRHNLKKAVVPLFFSAPAPPPIPAKIVEPKKMPAK